MGARPGSARRCSWPSCRWRMSPAVFVAATFDTYAGAAGGKSMSRAVQFASCGRDDARHLRGRRRHDLARRDQDPHCRYRHAGSLNPSCAAELALGRAGDGAADGHCSMPGRSTSVPMNATTDIYGRKLRILSRDGHSLGDVLVDEGLAHVWDGSRHSWCGAGAEIRRRRLRVQLDPRLADGGVVGASQPIRPRNGCRKDCPSGVRLYSTLGGWVGKTLRAT